MDNKFEIGGKHFSLTKLDAFKQFHIVRRMGPILVDLLPEIQKLANLKNFDKLPEGQKFEKVAKLAVPFMHGLAKLTDEDSEYVLHGLLNGVEIQQAAGNWARVILNGTLMFSDIELPMLIQIAARAFMFNLSGFFAGLPQ